MSTPECQIPSACERTSGGVTIRLLAALVALAAGVGALTVAILLVRSVL